MSELKLLKYGSSGPYVQMLQLALYRSGYYHELPDGIFGVETQDAVINFQKAFSLIADGIVGEKTWNALMPWLLGYSKHVIRKGDTIYRLSRNYATTVRAIEAANPGIDPFALNIGSTVTIPLAFPVVSENINMSPAYLDICIDGLTARYPFISRRTIGNSVMKTPIEVLVAGNGDNNVFYNASHHANEWITSTLLMKFLENYAMAKAFSGTIFGQSAQTLFELTTLHIAPMINPDGVALVTGELTDGEFYNNAVRISKDYPQVEFPLGWKANIHGIDPNLQYPAGWSSAKEIKFAQGYVSPAPRDYVGAAPLEIPESRAVYNYTISNDFSLTLSYHTQGRVIYWRYLHYLPDNSYEIAQQFSAVSGYDAEITPSESGYAGYKDWFISAYDRPGYTVEAGEGVSPLPFEEFAEIYKENEGILTLGLSLTA